MRNLITSLALAAALAAPVALHADPMMNGQFSIQGTVVPSSTTLSFVDLTITTGYLTQSGSFATLLTDGEHLSLGGMPAPVPSPYGPISIVPYNPYPGPGFLDFSFGNLSASVQTLVEAPGIGGTFDFAGTALLDAPGFAETPATFDFSTQASGRVTLSATAIASPVPEPSALLLFGTGALGLAGIVSKKFIA